MYFPLSARYVRSHSNTESMQVYSIIIRTIVLMKTINIVVFVLFSLFSFCSFFSLSSCSCNWVPKNHSRPCLLKAICVMTLIIIKTFQKPCERALCVIHCHNKTHIVDSHKWFIFVFSTAVAIISFVAVDSVDLGSEPSLFVCLSHIGKLFCTNVNDWMINFGFLLHLSFIRMKRSRFFKNSFLFLIVSQNWCWENKLFCSAREKKNTQTQNKTNILNERKTKLIPNGRMLWTVENVVMMINENVVHLTIQRRPKWHSKWMSNFRFDDARQKKFTRN